MKKFTLIILISFIVVSYLKSHDFVKFGYNYIGDYFYNFRGGYKCGMGYLGMTTSSIDINTENAKLWRGGDIIFKLALTHGTEPSVNYFGDIQIASNIEAGNHIYVQELYYAQKIGNVTLSIGLKDICNNFIVTETAEMFLNSSFGTPSVISLNFPVSIFPLTSPGLELKYNFNKSSYLVTSIYDGMPYDWEENPYNLRWDISKKDGYIFLGEANLSFFSEATILKIGYFSRYNKYENEKYKYGIYFISDIGFQKIEDFYKYNLLFQYTIIPKRNTDYNNYIGLGFRYKINKTKEDYIGWGLAMTEIKGSKDEYTFELIYKYYLNQYINIQPSFCYIMNPGRTNDLKDVFASFLRLNLEF